LIEGKAIQIHPLVCTAFNADFDGDQMAVHVPLSAEAQAEARILMLSSNNILSPASGRPITIPTQDMVLGIYHLTGQRDGAIGEGRAFTGVSEAIMALDRHDLSLQAKIKIRLDNVTLGDDFAKPEGFVYGDSILVETTLGRALFNDALPSDYPFVNTVVGKNVLGEIINEMADTYPKVAVAGTLDQLKELGFYWATRSGVSVGIEDVVVPKEKEDLLKAAEDEAEKVEKDFTRGLLADSERRTQLIDIWTKVTDSIAKATEKNFDESNPIYIMATSGARGNMLQVRQLAGMRGLVSNTRGEIMPRPIKANFREGLSVLEYFISTHGARKGLADTALRTADAGYLTRRLVDVSQDVIIREVDCDTELGLPKIIGEIKDGVLKSHPYAATAVVSRTLSEDVLDANGAVIATRNTYVTNPMVEFFISHGISELKVRSVLTCESKLSTCGTCYGLSLATNRAVELGEAIGIIAAQSIGEPGTQLTMRTFHTGGAIGAGGARDITYGLPRVVELFEAREPKGKAPIAEADGVISIEMTDKEKIVNVIPNDGSDPQVIKLLKKQVLIKVNGKELQDGDSVVVGQPIIEGVIDPKDKLRIQGPREAQKFLVNEVQEVYRSQGQSIHDKHIEVIVRQMLRRIIIGDSGDTDFLVGDLVDRAVFQTKNREVVANGGQSASGRPELMGITKASLATESWLSAASFQETTKVLTDAALQVRSDKLLGLKENVILGKLIPAGTGLAHYRNVVVEPTEEAKASMYASLSSYADDYGDVGFGGGSGEAVPLDDFRLNDQYR
jgi:DNA-directed RNA polymerase subunit beta'